MILQVFTFAKNESVPGYVFATSLISLIQQINPTGVSNAPPGSV
jgi:hypothetical protein